MKKIILVLLVLILVVTGCGKPGPTGPQGATGPAGSNGTDGKDGKDGNNGAPGLNGTDGKDGKDGAPGAPGAPAPTPVASYFVREYTGTVTILADHTYVNVPEIINQRESTYILVFYIPSLAPTGSPWSAMTDNWSEVKHFSISWSGGQVDLAGMSVGDQYLIQIFRTN